MNEWCTLEGDPVSCCTTAQYLYPHHPQRKGGDSVPMKRTTIACSHILHLLRRGRRNPASNPSDKGLDFPMTGYLYENIRIDRPPLLYHNESVAPVAAFNDLPHCSPGSSCASANHHPLIYLYWQRHEQDECKKGSCKGISIWICHHSTSPLHLLLLLLLLRWWHGVGLWAGL